jgi:hypothetical protein
MGIQSKAMFAHQVDYMCDSCNAGVMRPTGVMLMSNPPQYPHLCSCGASATFRVQYPHIEFRDTEYQAPAN